MADRAGKCDGVGIALHARGCWVRNEDLTSKSAALESYPMGWLGESKKHKKKVTEIIPHYVPNFSGNHYKLLLWRKKQQGTEGKRAQQETCGKSLKSSGEKESSLNIWHSHRTQSWHTKVQVQVRTGPTFPHFNLDGELNSREWVGKEMSTENKETLTVFYFPPQSAVP